MEDGKGTRIKSIWDDKEHWANLDPYNPTYEQVYHFYEDSDKQVKEDGTGYVCAILTTGYEKKNRPGSSPRR